MYNSIKLKEEHWCYQLYLWHDKLSSLNEPKWKVIKTLIYVVKSSGNQGSLRETSNLLKDEYPRENNNNNYGLQNHRLIKPLRFARLCCRMVEFYWFVPPVFIQFIFECVNINSVYDLSREVVPCFCYPEVKGVVLDTPHSVIRFW